MNFKLNKSTHKIIPLFTVCLFAIYPILVLYSHNISEVVLEDALWPISFSIILSTCIFVGLQIFLKNTSKSALLSIAFLIIFWNYRLLFNTIAPLKIIEHWHMLPVLFFLYFHLIFFVSKIKSQDLLNKLNTILLMPILVLLVINLITILPAEIKKNKKSRIANKIAPKPEPTSINSAYPDICLIILDEFANLNTIKEEWGSDMKDFRNFMKKKNLFNAENSEVRYCHTNWSLPNLLNMDYLTSYVSHDTFLKYIYKPSAIKDTEVYNMLESMDFTERIKIWNNNFLMNFLKQKGYEIHVLEGVTAHYHNVNFDNADFHFAYEDVNPEAVDASLNPFHLELIKSSIIFPLDYIFKIDHSRNNNYYGTKYIFNYLNNPPAKTSRPRFTLAHILCPHSPYVFDANGEYRSPVIPHGDRKGILVKENNEVNEAYFNQYLYVVNELKKLINSNIKKNTDNNPVIIIQSDHGPRPHMLFVKEHERAFDIFNAVYLPDGDYSELYDNIGQINTLRLILNKYFDTQFEMLQDK